MREKLEEFFESIKRNDGKTRGWVYFITEGSRRQAMKIGFSVDPQRRLKSIQTDNPSPIKMIGMVPAFKEHEKWLHKLLKPWRIRGEWYSCDQTIFDFIRDVTKFSDNPLILHKQKTKLSLKEKTRILRAPQDRNMACMMNVLLNSSGGEVPYPPNYQGFQESMESAGRVEETLLETIDSLGPREWRQRFGSLGWAND